LRIGSTHADPGVWRRATASEEEARTLSPAPALPRSFDKWLSLPRDLDRFLGDHFGLREQLVRAHGVLRYAVLLPTDLRVLIGRDNWLFLTGDGTIEQSTGRLLRPAVITEFAARARALQERLKVRNARFLVAVPPNSSTINRARLPAWAAAKPSLSEYDLMMTALISRGVPALDLRPPLLAANSVNPTYRRTDTHWNRLFALLRTMRLWKPFTSRVGRSIPRVSSAASRRYRAAISRGCSPLAPT
jgi:hypothetical protein